MTLIREASAAQASLLEREFDLKLPPAKPAAATSQFPAPQPRSHKRKQPARSPHPLREETEVAGHTITSRTADGGASPRARIPKKKVKVEKQPEISTNV